MDRCCIGKESPTIGQQARVPGSLNTTTRLENAIVNSKSRKPKTKRCFQMAI
jgi:hypothetical protein